MTPRGWSLIPQELPLGSWRHSRKSWRGESYQLPFFGTFPGKVSGFCNEGQKEKREGRHARTNNSFQAKTRLSR